jgi:aminoglycoside phosphotransferase (APT) family kinase protein
VTSDIDQAVAVAAGILRLDPSEIGVRRLARGVTHETLILEGADGPAGVLRLAPADRSILPRHSPSEEGRLLDMLAGSYVPVPRVLLNDPDGKILGREGLLLSYAQGFSTLGWSDFRERCGHGVDEHALQTLCELHSLDTAGWPDSNDPDGHAQRDLAGASSLMDEAGEAAPAELRHILEELAQKPPARSGPPCIVHGDYRPANMMARDGRVTAVLDWEMSTVGDRACDFGISTMPHWGTWWPDAELLRRYAERSGVEVSLVSVRWWRCLGYGKVVAFLARRTAAGWGTPQLETWIEGLVASHTDWRADAGA